MHSQLWYFTVCRLIRTKHQRNAWPAAATRRRRRSSSIRPICQQVELIGTFEPGAHEDAAAGSGTADVVVAVGGVAAAGVLAQDVVAKAQAWISTAVTMVVHHEVY